MLELINEINEMQFEEDFLGVGTGLEGIADRSMVAVVEDDMELDSVGIRTCVEMFRLLKSEPGSDISPGLDIPVILMADDEAVPVI